MKNIIRKNKKFNKEYESFNEAYNLLRTNLQYSFTGDKESKVILITSAEQGDGKSTVSFNLANKLSDLGKKVLLIDIDIRKPSQHKKFNISNLWGLTDILVGECEINQAKQTISENLSVITAGKKVPIISELISSREFKTIINKLREDYDYIIIDSAPINVISDAIGILGEIDGVILVARYRKTKKRSVYNVCKKINQANGKILGVVFNGVELNSNSYYYYYYQNNYYKDHGM